MNTALVTNSDPRSNDALFRVNAFAPNLAREAPGAAAEVTLFAAEPERFAAVCPGSFQAIRPLPDFRDPNRLVGDNRFELVVLDYDATAGCSRKRAEFLRLGIALLEASRNSAMAVLASDSNAFPERISLSLRETGNRSLFQRLLEEATFRLAFADTTASRLREKTGNEIQVIPAGSPIPSPRLSRMQARARLGFKNNQRDLIIGVLGRYGELDLDWFNAGCSEASRIAPFARLLYLGPDGALIRRHRFPIPFLDAGLPSPEEISVRLRAMDFAILPATARANARPDRLPLIACLQHGVPVVATSPPRAETLLDARSHGLALVPGGQLGTFIEAVEACCHRIARQSPNRRESDPSVEAYYETHLSAQAALNQMFAEAAREEVLALPS